MMRQSAHPRPLLAVMLFLLWPAAAAAQPYPALEARIGIAAPLGQLADFTDAGPALGVGVSLPLSGAVALRVGGDVAWLEEGTLSTGRSGPGVNLLHGHVGLAWSPLGEETGQRLQLELAGGAGLSNFEVETFVAPSGQPGGGGSFTISQTYPAIHGSAEASYALSRSLEVTGGMQVVGLFGKESDTAPLENLAAGIDRFEHIWSLPFTLGLRYRF